MKVLWFIIKRSFSFLAVAMFSTAVTLCMALRTPNVNGGVRSNKNIRGNMHNQFSTLTFVVTRPSLETSCSLSKDQAEDLKDEILEKEGRRRRRRVVVKSNPYKLPSDKEEQWMFFYEMLCEHNRKHSHTVVSIPAGPAVNQSLLRNWCADQRKSYMKTLGVLDIGQRANWGTSYLTWHKKQLLDQAGFYWGHFNHTMDDDYVFSDEFQDVVKAKYQDWLWNPFYDKLKAYQQRHNHTRIPHNYTDQLLSVWATQQRLLYQIHEEKQKLKLETNHATLSSSEDQVLMPQRRIKKLNEINFEWSWLDENSKYSELNLTMLTTGIGYNNSFYRNKDLPEYDIMLPFDAFVLENLDQNDPFFPPSLGIIDINALLKKKKTNNVVPWAQRVRQLKEYRKEHGNCDVPLDYEKVSGLGTWVKKQQSNRKLSPRSRYQLQKLGFTFHFD